MADHQRGKITFFGGAQTVTGSKALVEYEGFSVLIDCGLFQGLKDLREMNWDEPGFDASEIDAVLLTHAHLDHCGYLPVLCKNGFNGTIHCTHPTRELTEIILSDSGKIQEEDAERSNRYEYSRHDCCKPLYTQKDALNCLQNFESHNYDEWVLLTPHIKFRLVNAGHILGSAMVELRLGQKTIVFSGDIGRKDPMLMYPAKKLDHADYIVLESTYGDRIHKIEDVKSALCDIIQETYNRGGILMIPSFAVERTQELIYLIYQLKEEGKLPNIPVFLDSPMGVKSTQVFEEYPEWQDIPAEHARHMYSSVKFIQDYQASKAVVSDKKPKVVLAGSGMMEGGRILHYLLHHANNPKNTILFVGFQAVGTRGRQIVQGADSVKFFGEYHPINCEIKSISSMSAHGDRKEMLDWLSHFKNKPTQIFLNHGEPHQLNAFRVYIETKLGWDVKVPFLQESFWLD